jgi:hypothetical protein
MMYYITTRGYRQGISGLSNILIVKRL